MATIPLVLLLRTNEQRGIGDIVNEAAVAACGDVPRYVVPFPGNGQQWRFLDAMARIVPALPRVK